MRPMEKENAKAFAAIMALGIGMLLVTCISAAMASGNSGADMIDESFGGYKNRAGKPNPFRVGMKARSKSSLNNHSNIDPTKQDTEIRRK